jgi:glycosyltransferase involved in cell wall biosynthesis
MTKILLVVDRLLRPYRTGIDRYYDEIIYRLPRLAPDFEFTLISLGEPDQQLPSFASNLKHHGLPISRGRFFATSLLGLPTQLQSICEQADLVHLLTPMPLTTQVPLLTTVHDLTPLFLTNVYPWHVRFLSRRTIRLLAAAKSSFCTVSEQTGEDLHNLLGVPLSRIHPIPLGVGDEFEPQADPEKTQTTRTKYGLPAHYFLFIGSMHPRKNLPTLLKAYQKFRETDDSGTGLVVAGRMDLGGTQLLQSIREDGLENRVVLPGYIDAPDLPTVISGADALLYPTLYEGFGLPVLEAMACGTIVIASRVGAISEVAKGDALLYEPFDVNGFAEGMRKVVSDPAWGKAAVQRGLQRAARYSWQSTATSTLELYREFLR